MSTVTPDWNPLDYEDPRTLPADDDLFPDHTPPAGDEFASRGSYPTNSDLCWRCNQRRVGTAIGLCGGCRDELRR